MGSSSESNLSFMQRVKGVFNKNPIEGPIEESIAEHIEEKPRKLEDILPDDIRNDFCTMGYLSMCKGFTVTNYDDVKNLNIGFIAVNRKDPIGSYEVQWHAKTIRKITNDSLISKAFMSSEGRSMLVNLLNNLNYKLLEPYPGYAIDEYNKILMNKALK